MQYSDSTYYDPDLESFLELFSIPDEETVGTSAHEPYLALEGDPVRRSLVTSMA